MLAVVTGAGGHLGAALVRELLARGQAVRAVIRRRAAAEIAGLEVEVVRADVRDPDALLRAFTGADVVYHLAAAIETAGGDEAVVRAVNVDGARNAAAAALAGGVRRLVHFSSVNAFDRRHVAALDETCPRPGPSHPAYDRSKAAGEDAVRAVVARGLDAVIVNPTGVIGPFDFGPSRMGQIFLDLRAGRLPALVDGGHDWVDVRDVAASAIAAATRGHRGDNYLLGGHWHHLRELGAFMQAATGVAPPRLVAPMWLARLGAPVASGLNRLRGQLPLFTRDALEPLAGHRTVCSDKAARELGHAPRPVADTVRDLYASFDRREPTA